MYPRRQIVRDPALADVLDDGRGHELSALGTSAEPDHLAVSRHVTEREIEPAAAELGARRVDRKYPSCSVPSLA